jgi:hypothetical protein
MLKIFCCLFISTFLMLWGNIPQKVLICGVCRDIESSLPYSKKIVEEIGSLFSDYFVLLYENNSVDRTVHCLQEWAKENPRVIIETEVLGTEILSQAVLNRTENGEFFRPEAIARARNIVLKKALSTDYEEFPYVIWIDMDFVVSPSLEGLIEVFQTSREWDGVFAYGIAPDDRYWDWYACRYPAFPFGPELLGMSWYRMEQERVTDLVLTQDSDWLPVYSAFGGCGIYKKSSIRDCVYSGVVTEDVENLMSHLLSQGLSSFHPQALRYIEKLQELKNFTRIDRDAPIFPKIEDPLTGIILHEVLHPMIWRMNTFTYQYPSLCEHIPFHASMIIRGHDKLFINPRLIFRYGAIQSWR